MLRGGLGGQGGRWREYIIDVDWRERMMCWVDVGGVWAGWRECIVDVD